MSEKDFWPEPSPYMEWKDTRHWWWDGYIHTTANHDKMKKYLSWVNEFGFFSYRFLTYRGYGEWLDAKDNGLTYNEAKIYFRKKNDATLFMLTFKGDT